jgi:hypothetical protein
MNCTICGQATLPGAMLCRPCKAALKRARYLSVQDLPRASILRPRRRKGSAAKRAGTQAVAASAGSPAPEAAGAARPRASSSARQLLLGAGAIAVLGLVAYFGQRHMGAGAADPPAPAVRDVPVVLAPLSEPAAAAEPAVPLAAPQVAPAAPVPPPNPPVAEVSPPATKAGRVRPRAAPRPDPKAVAATEVPPVVVEPVAPPPEPVPPPPPPAPRPAPPPDRWQTMSNALAQCAREGGFGGFLCDQKVRLDSCEGYWGRVPQCPLPPENPGGQ